VELAPADERYEGGDGRGQSTGASLSTLRDFLPLRQTAAAAREALAAAAAEHLGVTAAEVVQDGRAFHAAGRPTRRVRFGELIDTAPRHLRAKGTPKPREQWRWVGKAHPRLDAALKASGRADFGIDVNVPGLRYASVWRGLNAEEQRAVAERLRPTLAHGLELVEIEAGVAVVGPNTWAPMRLIKEAQASEWGQPILRSGDVDDAAIDAALSSALAEGKAARARDDGDFDRVEGEQVVEWQLSFPYLAHQSMEPMNATAHVKRSDGKVVGAEIWVPSQGIGIARSATARALGVSAERVVAHQTFVGGGFGRRGDYDFVLEAVELSEKMAGPIRVTWSREDDIRFDKHRPATRHLIQARVAGGELVGWRHRVAGPSLLGEVLPRLMEPDSPLTAGVARAVTDLLFDNALAAAPIAVECAAELPYAIENVRVEHAAVDPGIPITFWRANGASFNSFVVETALDEVARHLKADPIELRLRLLGEHPRHRGVLEAVRDLSGWRDRALPEGRALGVAVVESYDSFVAQVAEVSVDEGRPRVHRVFVAIDCGIAVNPDGVAQQMESGVIWGLSAAFHQNLDFAGGRPLQSNFHDLPILRMHESPEIETVIVDSDEPPSGVGEPGVPPIAPAVANALRALGHGPFPGLPLRLSPRARSRARAVR
jgi:CO/xanthine dehydrogenase Mo-binding subunit